MLAPVGEAPAAPGRCAEGAKGRGDQGFNLSVKAVGGPGKEAFLPMVKKGVVAFAVLCPRVC